MTVKNASSKQDVVHNVMPSLNLRGQLQWQVEKTTKCWLVAMILLRMFSAGIWCDTYTHKRQQQQQKCELLTFAKVSSPRAPLPLGNIYINEL